MQNQFKFQVGQVITARLGNPGDVGYTKEKNENVQCVVLARQTRMIGEAYLIIPVGNSKVCAAFHSQEGMSEDLYSTSALPVREGSRVETIGAAAELLGFTL